MGGDLPPIYYSSEERLALAVQLGMAHYSYRFVESKFIGLLQEIGYPVRKLELPPYYGAGQLATKSLPKPVHLIFRSTENIRPIPDCYNICCFAWEFEILKGDTLAFEHPFLNQIRMLQACEEVWTLSQYSRDILYAYGISNVHYVPAPQPAVVEADEQQIRRALASVAQLPSVQLTINNMVTPPPVATVAPLGARACIDQAMQAKQLFVTVLNPHDRRKNLRELILGFVTAASEHPDAALIIKLVASQRNAGIGRILASDILPRFDRPISLDCPNVVVISGYLPDAQLAALYGIANFYLCASVAEGQNLPLVEAMAHGVVPVSTINTAMTSYLSPDNGIPVHSARIDAFDRNMGADIVRRRFAVDFASQSDVARSVAAACKLPPAEMVRLRTAARAAVTDEFAPGVVGERIRQRFQAVQDERA